MTNEDRQRIRIAVNKRARKRVRLEGRIEKEIAESLAIGLRCACKSMRNHTKGCVYG